MRNRRAQAVPLPRSRSAFGFADSDLLGENWSVGGADPAGDDRTDIAEHGGPEVVGELVKVLMGDRQRESILACLRQNEGEAFGRKRLEFVGIQMEGAAVGGRYVAP